MGKVGDWLAGGGLSGIASAVQAFGGLLTGAGQLNAAKEANQIEQGNLDLAKEHFKYEQGLQQEMFGREDSAYQRKVADLKEAGLSPVLAAQGSGSSSGPVVNTSAPQRGVQAAQMKMGALASMANVGQSIAETALITERLLGEKSRRQGQDLQNHLQNAVNRATIRLDEAGNFYSVAAEAELKKLRADADVAEVYRRYEKQLEALVNQGKYRNPKEQEYIKLQAAAEMAQSMSTWRLDRENVDSPWLKVLMMIAQNGLMPFVK